jgi:hypothetical protein
VPATRSKQRHLDEVTIDVHEMLATGARFNGYLMAEALPSDSLRPTRC